ncbi:MAG: ammonia-forming cytochrome c nitrite reductase subunit c552 [Chloroflexaceae bacterium]|nr:ammonia-forming cytochrome c nitrite reductase subunit c552 [Chloroflexaceae bacterium]
MLNVANACQTCHNYSEDEIQARVLIIQDRTNELMNNAEVAVGDLISDIEAAAAAGIPAEDLTTAREFHRHAQWWLDFVAAENSMGCHAPQEAARVLGESADLAR